MVALSMLIDRLEHARHAAHIRSDYEAAEIIAARIDGAKLARLVVGGLTSSFLPPKAYDMEQFAARVVDDVLTDPRRKPKPFVSACEDLVKKVGGSEARRELGEVVSE